ncbi:hypothetical protein [Pseudidiomarina mangrovi]|uniref:hypothetical protein n=1 Tax=Pseudidiomarina mangrovi TaxID=2487133 RepID=UPI000FCB442E|nr:hypothetical protein [Pseudidiomarina mangrovi]
MKSVGSSKENSNRTLTLAVMFIVVGVMSPVDVRTLLMFTGFFLILVSGTRFIFHKEELRLKLFFILMSLPGLFISLYSFEVETLIRYMLIFLLISLTSLRSTLDVDEKSIGNLCLVVIVLLVFFQISLAVGYFLEFREAFYLNSEENNNHDYGFTQSLFSGFRGFRAGGLFWNPNVMASNIFMLFLIYTVSTTNESIHNKYTSTKKYISVSMVVFFSIMLSGSRTYLLAFLSFIVLLIYQSQGIKKTFLLLSSCATILYAAMYESINSIFEEVLRGVTEDSLNTKLNILIDYIMALSDENDFLPMLFGGRNNVHFDFDYGYLIGMLGFIGILFFYLNLIIFSLRSKLFFLYLTPIMVASVGNSMFYNINTVFLILSLIVVFVSNYRKNNPVRSEGE